MEPLRTNFIHLLQLLASRSLQDRYQSEAGADISGEFVCMWFDDFYSPSERDRIRALLSERERVAIDAFDAFYRARVDALSAPYAELRESPLWAEVIAEADATVRELGWDRTPTVWGFGAV